MAHGDLLTSTQAGLILGKSGRTVTRNAQQWGLEPVATLPGDNGARLYRRADVLALAARLSQPTEAAS